MMGQHVVVAEIFAQVAEPALNAVQRQVLPEDDTNQSLQPTDPEIVPFDVSALV